MSEHLKPFRPVDADTLQKHADALEANAKAWDHVATAGERISTVIEQAPAKMSEAATSVCHEVTYDSVAVIAAWIVLRVAAAFVNAWLDGKIGGKPADKGGGAHSPTPPASPAPPSA